MLFLGPLGSLFQQRFALFFSRDFGLEPQPFRNQQGGIRVDRLVQGQHLPGLHQFPDNLGRTLADQFREFLHGESSGELNHLFPRFGDLSDGGRLEVARTILAPMHGNGPKVLPACSIFPESDLLIIAGPTRLPDLLELVPKSGNLTRREFERAAFLFFCTTLL